jgi:hypothetical protein
MGVPKMLMPLSFNKATGDQAITQQEAKANNKAHARYPHAQYPNDLAKGGGGGSHKKALTPGSSPSGS